MKFFQICKMVLSSFKRQKSLLKLRAKCPKIKNTVNAAPVIQKTEFYTVSCICGCPNFMSSKVYLNLILMDNFIKNVDITVTGKLKKVCLLMVDGHHTT